METRGILTYYSLSVSSHQDRNTAGRGARKSPTQQRSREMRKHLLASTHELLAKSPSVRPTTTALAEHAHVSIGTVYRYFPDIDTIVDELRMSAVHDITTTLSTAIGRAITAFSIRPSRTASRAAATAAR